MALEIQLPFGNEESFHADNVNFTVKTVQYHLILIKLIP